MGGWTVERILHFGPGDFVSAGLAHFGFHLRDGRYVAIEHQRHFMGLVGDDGQVTWTAAAQPVLPGVPNIVAELAFPMFADVLPDGAFVVT